MSQPETEVSEHNGERPNTGTPNGKHVGDHDDIDTTKTEGSRCFINILSFSLTFGLCTLCTQALTLYISSQITTLEKQYNLSSSESGIILSCNDIGFILTVLFFSHFGKRFHIPRILGVSVAIYGISGILSSLPQFISWPDDVDSSFIPENSSLILNSKHVLCDQHPHAQTNCTSVSGSGSKEAGYKWVVLYIGICMAIQGVGKSPRSSLGTLYLDSNVDKTKTALYLGIVKTLGLFGPFLALVLGGLFGKIPVDLQETEMTPSDPRWIGAWWIGFLVFGILALLLAFPLACFPRHLGKQRAEESIKIDEDSTSHLDSEETFKSQAKDLPKALVRIFTNRVYILHLIGVLCTMLSVVSLTSFGPKYIETQFNLPTWKANIILGIEKIITSTTGTFLGGLLTTRLKLDRVGCFKMVAIIHFVTSAVGSLQYIFGCNNQDIHDINESPTTNGSISTCYCDTNQYLGICGEDGYNYFSPCHAGCVNFTANTYSGCSAINGGHATSGLCDDGCPYLIPYVAASVIQTLIGTMAILPMYIGFLRTVEPRDRALGMGMISFLLALLVFIPGPILVGKLIDSACRFRQSSCRKDGACALYDIVDLRIKMVSVYVILTIISFAFNLLTIVVASRNKNNECKDEQTKIELKKIKPSVA